MCLCMCVCVRERWGERRADRHRGQEEEADLEAGKSCPASVPGVTAQRRGQGPRPCDHAESLEEVVLQTSMQSFPCLRASGTRPACPQPLLSGPSSTWHFCNPSKVKNLTGLQCPNENSVREGPSQSGPNLTVQPAVPQHPRGPFSRHHQATSGPKHHALSLVTLPTLSAPLLIMPVLSTDSSRTTLESLSWLPGACQPLA